MKVLGQGGDIVTQNFDRYPVERMQSVPAIEVHLIDSDNTLHHDETSTHVPFGEGVLDFDAVLRDPQDPTVIYAPWRHDCYHPNATGDQLLGQSINLSVFGLPATGR